MINTSSLISYLGGNGILDEGEAYYIDGCLYQYYVNEARTVRYPINAEDDLMDVFVAKEICAKFGLPYPKWI